MAINLVSLVTDFLTPDMIGRTAGTLGLDSNKVESALGAGIPGLLAGLSGVAASPGGPQKLVEAARQESGTLGKLVDSLDADPQSSVARGSQMLGSLLGSRDHNALTEAIGRFAGIGQGQSGSLLGMLAPIVMGMIARQPGSLNANGMANLFAGQKDNIAAAMPAGFGRLLGGTGLLDSLSGAAATANQTARTAGSAVYGTAGRAAAGAAPAAAARWLWLIPAALIAAGLAYWLNGPARQAAEQTVASAHNLTVGGVDIGKQASDSLSSLRTTLSGVTDVDSAKAALPKLQQVTDQIDKTNGMIGSLSADQRKVLANLVSPTMSEVNQLFDKVLAIPGVAGVLKPTLDTMKAKLANLKVA